MKVLLELELDVISVVSCVMFVKYHGTLDYFHLRKMMIMEICLLHKSLVKLNQIWMCQMLISPRKIAVFWV